MLFVVAMPTDKNIGGQAWNNYRGFMNYITNLIAQFSNVERLGDNVLLVNARNDLAPLARLVTSALDAGMPYRLLVFDDEPQWIPATPNAPPTSGHP